MKFSDVSPKGQARLAAQAVVDAYATNRATAVAANGLVLTSDVIVSPKLWMIRTIIQTPTKSTCTIILWHAPATAQIPTQLAVRVDAGLHGATRGRHPAHGTWTVTARPNPYEFELVGSTWVADSVCEAGHCWVPNTLIEASAPLNRLNEALQANGGGLIRLPVGGMYLQAEVLRISLMKGYGSRKTFFTWADYIDRAVGANRMAMCGHGPVSATAYANYQYMHWEGISFLGNRTEQVYNVGLHAVQLGDGSNTMMALSGRWKDVRIWGSAGYGWSLGDANGKINIIFEDSGSVFSDSDGVDMKNRLDMNDSIHFIRPIMGWHGMGDQGTDLAQYRALEANGITTIAGTTTCSLNRVLIPTANVGSYMTLSGSTTFDGVNPNGSWPIVNVDNTKIYIDVGQTPIVGGLIGGGASVTYFTPTISGADAAIDVRGYNCSIIGGRWYGELWARDGFRSRPGQAGLPNSNGAGAHRMIIDGANGVDYTKSWVRNTIASRSGSFVSVGGDDVSVRGVKFFTQAGSGGIAVGPYAKRAIISDFSIIGSRFAVLNTGEDTKIFSGNIVNPTEAAIQNHGAVIRTVTVFQTTDPFRAAALNSNVVIVTRANHGLTQGAAVSYSGGLTSGPGITVLRSNLAEYQVTQVDNANEYRIIGLGSATALTSFGGDDIFELSGSINHDAINCSIDDVAISHDDPSNVCSPLVFGSRSGFLNGYSTGTKVSNVRNNGCKGRIIDYGTDTIYLDGNTGGILSNPGTGTASVWTLVEEVTLTSTTGSFVDFTNLRYYPSLRIELMGIVHSTGSFNLGMTASNTNGQTRFEASGSYQKLGVSQSTTAIVIAGSTVDAARSGADIEIINFNSKETAFYDVNGGQEGVAFAASNTPVFMIGSADVPLNALRIYSSGNLVGGKIRIWQKGA